MPPTPEQEQLIRGQQLAVLATLRKDGTAQLTPINYAYKDGNILISTTKTRVKYHNVRRNPRVSLCVIDPAGRPYVTVFGRARIEEDDIAPPRSSGASWTGPCRRTSPKRCASSIGSCLS